MKDTGMNHKIDRLGNFVIPKKLRRILNININDPIEFFTEEGAIILRKYTANMACMITGEISNKNVSLFVYNELWENKGS
ncbi:TPA: AbrB/MazE/SpoVT family DNA-binding domain-containing protein [Bacillus cereus]